MVNEAAIVAHATAARTILAGDLDEGLLRSMPGLKANRRMPEASSSHRLARGGPRPAAELCPPIRRPRGSRSSPAATPAGWPSAARTAP